MGLEFLVSTHPLEQIGEFLANEDGEAFDTNWIERPAEVAYSGVAGVKTSCLRFDWDVCEATASH